MYLEYVTEVLEHVLNLKINLLVAQHVPGKVFGLASLSLVCSNRTGT